MIPNSNNNGGPQGGGYGDPSMPNEGPGGRDAPGGPGQRNLPANGRSPNLGGSHGGNVGYTPDPDGTGNGWGDSLFGPQQGQPLLDPFRGQGFWPVHNSGGGFVNMGDGTSNTIAVGESGMVSGAPGSASHAMQSGGSYLDPIDEVINLIGLTTQFDLQDLKAVGNRIRQLNADKAFLREALSKLPSRGAVKSFLEANPETAARLKLDPQATERVDGESDEDADARVTTLLKGTQDGLADLTQEGTFELQTIMTRISQATQVRSNMSAKDSAAKDAVIGNIRG